MSGSAGAPAPSWGSWRRRRGTCAAAIAMAALACGGGEGVTIPRAQATAPVDDETDLAGVPRPGVTATGDPGTGATSGTDTDTGASDGTAAGGAPPSGGAGGDSNASLNVGVHLSDVGRRALTEAGRQAVSAATWRAAWSPAGDALALEVWPQPSAGAAQAPLLTLRVPADPPLGVPMDIAAERGAEGALMWGRLRIDQRPPPGAVGSEAELAGDFELFGPAGVLAGPFRARPLGCP